MNRKRLLNVIPECYVDTNLIEFLLNASVNHQHCCSKVVGQLNTTFTDRFAIGIIDKDKVQVGYINECEVIAKTAHLTLLKHCKRHQYLITIAPAVDTFILDCAVEQNINPQTYNLPSELKKFTDVSKSVTSNSDYRFKLLFEAIKNNSEISSLKKSLNYLCENTFQSDLQCLKKIFKGTDF